MFTLTRRILCSQYRHFGAAAYSSGFDNPSSQHEFKTKYLSNAPQIVKSSFESKPLEERKKIMNTYVTWLEETSGKPVEDLDEKYWQMVLNEKTLSSAKKAYK
jgi:hypothetical protein